MKKTRRLSARGALGAALATAAAGLGLTFAGLFGPAAVATSANQSTDLVTPGAAGDNHDGHLHRHVGALSADSRFTDSDGTWPPQVKNATDIVELSFSQEDGFESADPQQRTFTADGSTAEQAIVDRVLADSNVSELVGDRYHVTDVSDDEIVPGTDKDMPTSKATLVSFFNLDQANTVEVFLANQTIVEVVVSDATDHQPSLSETEKEQAAALARSHWEAAGDSRIDQLEGFSILAVEPTGSYYDGRVAYVSFHNPNHDRPELITWVDLGERTILKAEVDR